MLMTQERKSTKEDQLNNLAKYEPRKDRATFLRGFSLLSDQPVAENRLVQVNFLQNKGASLAPLFKSGLIGARALFNRKPRRFNRRSAGV